MAREGDQEQAPQPVRPVRPASRYAARPPSAAGRAAGWAALLTLGLWAAGLAVAYLLASDAVPPGQCQGLGFGCTPSARDSVALLAVFTAAPVVGVTAVAVPLAAWLGGRRRGRGGLAAGATAAGLCWAVGLVVAALAYAR